MASLARGVTEDNALRGIRKATKDGLLAGWILAAQRLQPSGHHPPAGPALGWELGWHQSEAGRRAGPRPPQQQEEPQEAQVSHAIWEVNRHRLNLKSRPDGWVLGKSTRQGDGSDTEKGSLARGE